MILLFYKIYLQFDLGSMAFSSFDYVQSGGFICLCRVLSLIKNPIRICVYNAEIDVFQGIAARKYPVCRIQTVR